MRGGYSYSHQKYFEEHIRMWKNGHEIMFTIKAESKIVCKIWSQVYKRIHPLFIEKRGIRVMSGVDSRTRLPEQVWFCGLENVNFFFFFLPHSAAAKSLQSCRALCDPIDDSPPGSPVPGILQARTLEWVAISFSNARKWKVKVKSLSRVRL